ncbi:DUF6301 family protein [Nocardia sp. NBC_01503]|uniref:DUF6301 family protein n=1 Tax=Nocardia sp. NBC_01503 TaxID=2975997 RepID=UPI002E7AB48C|nr:DUF6301 family protein [Nocardia sp. NBC_01503]WTL35770.1 DUF6301 family protein [Nocardia sp. NBC_01503]
MTNRQLYYRAMRSGMDRAEEIVRIAARLDWTWTIADIDRFSSATGWAVLRRSTYGATMQTDLMVPLPKASVYTSGDQLKYFSIAVTDTNFGEPPSDPEGVVDDFAALGVWMMTELGRPARRTPGAESSIRWDLPNLVVSLSTLGTQVRLRLINPAYQEKEDHYDSEVRPWLDAEEKAAGEDQ